MSAKNTRRPTDNSSVRDLQHYLRLSDATLTRLQEEHFVSVRDVKSIPVDRFGELKLPMRDEITLRNFLFPPPTGHQNITVSNKPDPRVADSGNVNDRPRLVVRPEAQPHVQAQPRPVRPPPPGNPRREPRKEHTHRPHGKPPQSNHTSGNTSTSVTSKDKQRPPGGSVVPENPPKSHLRSNEKLLPGQSLFSSTKNLRLTMQSDGNLVLYRTRDNHPTWATNTHGQRVREAIMQQDGNLVIYGTSGHPIWATGTNAYAGTHCQVQDDGNFCKYESD
ncbi:hypothetical protein RvY_00403-2 [Ramazzottius varieornatus]|uniref:Bulb-type lectin domain-containing protein n=1 Tax=Ramazzottius varieornatus TaxID=947166 RepID=A0A1D1UD42_RAMVA|nr:hypothetical protein RvY_00403-2 [Ramazzottius varieornatus]